MTGVDKKHPPTESEFLLYQTEDGRTALQVILQQETVWLTINQMAELFHIDKSGISRHLKNIYEAGELNTDSTVAFFATVQKEGGREVTRQREYYNLDAIISVGYRVNSIRGTQFRIWATERLREYIIKGFILDDQRLKEDGGGKYFDELLERIRDIRSSEKVFWRKILDIYATSCDYNPKAQITRDFFAQVQNKMHWAAHGQTAAEIIYDRADRNVKDMGLTNYSGDRPRFSDATIAKNYLKEEELELLNRIVSMYLDFAELQALSRRPMYMKDWMRKLDDFLSLSDREVLSHSGKISHDQALEKAKIEYENFKKELINGPSMVEKHFIEAENKIRLLEDKTKKKGKAKSKKKKV